MTKHNRILLILALLISSFGVAACGMPPSDGVQNLASSTGNNELSTHKQGLHNFPKVLAYKFAETGNDLPHGIAGSKHYVFAARALVGRVSVFHRLTGQFIQDLPAPPGGFILPFALRAPSSNKLVVLDSGGFPSPTAPAIPRVYTYQFSRNSHTGQFTAELQNTVLVDSVPFGFAEDVEVLANGDMVLSDSVIGALWLIKSDNTVVPAITPASFAPQDAIPALFGCVFPTGQSIDGIPFAPAGGFAPGVGSMASRNGILYFSGSCLGGIRTIAVSTFYDNRAPHERAADIQVLSPKPANLEAESLKGLTFNRFNPNDSRLYAASPLQVSLLRINTTTGAREQLAQSGTLFNFTVAMTFLPPLIPGIHSMVAVGDQEHRFAAFNSALTEDMFLLPFILTKVVVLH